MFETILNCLRDDAEPRFGHAAIAAFFLMFWYPAAATDLEDCTAALDAAQYRIAARPCSGLRGDTPMESLALGVYSLYGRIGTRRLQEFTLFGLDRASEKELALWETGVDYLLTAAEGGLPHGQFLYAIMLDVATKDHRYPVKRSRDAKVEFWLHEAASSGHGGANYMLALDGISTLYPDYPIVEDEDALDRLEIAAAAGWPAAEKLLRRLRELDDVEARANQGDSQASGELASLQFNRLDLPESEIKDLTREAADAGDVDAMMRVGYSAWLDDPSTAKKYFLAAYSKGNLEALHALGDFYACSGDAEKAREYFSLADEHGYPVARYSLAELEEWGIFEWSCER